MNIVELTTSEIELMGVHMVLLPEAAIYIPSRRELLIADLHLGKDEHFRKHGISLPGDISGKDIDILHTLIATYMPTKVVFLGDLFHSDYNTSWDRLTAMMKESEGVQYYLVVGNHDILHADRYSGMTVVTDYEIGDIVCTHEPLDIPIVDKYNLCGHIHPSVRMRGKGRQYLKLPCYYFSEQMGILPAFGTFTGMYTMKPTATDRVYVIAGESVQRVY